MIFNIQKCSIHDGQGLRTLVFFKGCPLRCQWCANPESQYYEAEIMESKDKCIGCGACVRNCPQGAVVLTDAGPKIDRDRCRRCFSCTDRCYAASKYVIGKEYDVEELYKEIEKDRIFYSIKGGGVTFSGGEPLTQPEYLTKITKLCHERGIHVMLESCGYGVYDEFRHALPYIDSMFIDIKHIVSARHKELTGVGNEMILENIRKISDFGIPITIRTPIIPGLNDSAENIRGIAEFIRTLPQVTEYELLPYHQFGVNKYRALGRTYALAGVEPPTDEAMRNLVREANLILRGSGKTCFYTKDNRKETIQ